MTTREGVGGTMAKDEFEGTVRFVMTASTVPWEDPGQYVHDIAGTVRWPRAENLETLRCRCDRSLTMVDRTRDVVKERVGKLVVAFSPELSFATVCKRGLLVDVVIKEFDGANAFVEAKKWAEENQDRA
jgi:hypothetical protein